MIKAVVFDIWNTLAYNPHNLRFSGVSRFLGVKDTLKLDEIFAVRKYTSVNELIEDAKPHFSSVLHTRPFRKYIEKLITQKLDAKLYDDVEPVLKELRKSYKLGLLSNLLSFGDKPLQGTGLYKMVDARCLSYEEGIVKPDPQMFKLILKRLGVQPHQAVMVGDYYEADVLGAQNVGMKAILIKRGEDYLKHRIEKAEYKLTISSLYELPHLLAKW